jgi:hypothetical protein
MKRESEYSKLLRDPRWKQKRLEIIERDRGVCQMCGAVPKVPHVHHMHYWYGVDPWDYPDSMLVTLCPPCHDGEYSKRQAIDFLFKRMAEARLHTSEVYALAAFVSSLSRSVARLGQGSPRTVGEAISELAKGYDPADDDAVPLCDVLGEAYSAIMDQQ